MTSGLYKAVLEGRFKQVKFYIESGVRLGRPSGNEENVLLATLHLEHEDKRRKIFNYLLHRGANYWDADSDTGRDILLWACYLNRLSQVRKLIKFTAGNLSFSSVDKNGYCPIHFAVKHNNVDLVRILVSNFNKYGLSVDVPDHEGMTPLLHAEKLCYEEVAEVLKTEGHACPFRADDKSHGTVSEWKRAGQLQRTLEKQQRKQNDRIFGKRVAINVLPQIDPRGMYRTRTTLWNRSKTKHVSIHPALQTKAYNLPPNYRRNSIEKLRSILKYRPDEKVLMVDVDESLEGGISSIDGSSSMAIPRKPNQDPSVAASISQFMALLSEQISDAYRDPALDKIQEQIASTHTKSKRGTQLTRISNKVKIHAEEQEKKVKLKKELERQMKLLKKKGGETPVKDRKIYREKMSVSRAKGSREPSKIGLLPPIKN